MLVVKESKFIDMEVHPRLDELLTEVFTKMPNLEFHASRSRVEGKITEVSVVDDSQIVGKLSWVDRWCKGDYESCYGITSPKINKERGDRNTKYTTIPKSAAKIAREYLIKDSDNAIAAKIYKEFAVEVRSLLVHLSARYNSMCNQHYVSAFDYVASVVEGNTKPIDPKIVQLLNSNEYKELMSNYSIMRSVEGELGRSGVLVYVDKKDKLNVIELASPTMKRIGSSYDLPKNYQEKYTILKVMEYSQPIQHVGIKLKLRVDGDDAHRDYYYLCPGEMLITH